MASALGGEGPRSLPTQRVAVAGLPSPRARCLADRPHQRSSRRAPARAERPGTEPWGRSRRTGDAAPDGTAATREHRALSSQASISAGSTRSRWPHFRWGVEGTAAREALRVLVIYTIGFAAFATQPPLEILDPDVDVESVLPGLRLGDCLEGQDQALLGITNRHPCRFPYGRRHSQHGGPEARKQHRIAAVDDDLVDPPHRSCHAVLLGRATRKRWQTAPLAAAGSRRTWVSRPPRAQPSLRSCAGWSTTADIAASTTSTWWGSRAATNSVRMAAR